MATKTADSRLKRRFDKWDVNGNGTLERADFEREADKIVRLFGNAPDSAEALQMTDALTGMFDKLARQANVSSGGSLSEQQFNEIAGTWIEQGEPALSEALRPLVAGVFGLCDRNSDGKLQGEEFATWLAAIGKDKAAAQETFQQVDKDGSGELSFDEVLGTVVEFHLGLNDAELL